MDDLETIIRTPVLGGEVIAIPQAPDIAVGVQWVRDGVAEFRAFQTTGQVWYGDEFRIEDSQFGEYLATAHGPAYFGAALDFIAMVVFRLRQIDAESN
jgi:hypothetical protein